MTNSDTIQAALNNKLLNKSKNAIPTPFKELNKLTGGFIEGEVFVVSAAPSAGASSFVELSVINCIKNKIPVACYCPDLRNETTIARILQSMAKIDINKVNTGSLSEQDIASLELVKETLTNGQVFFYDKLPNSIDDLIELLTKMKQAGARIIFIDNLDIIQSYSDIDAKAIMKLIWQFAHENTISIIVLAEVVKYSGGYCRPDSFVLHNEVITFSSKILLLWQTDNVELDENQNKESNSIGYLPVFFELNKNNNGPLGKFEVHFQLNYIGLEEIVPF
jgi:archaellum biogenesis ATPase FlaH